MSTASCIRSYVLSRAADQLFTTRDVLHCGSRQAVDQTLYLMVKNHELVRWSSGVFSRPGATPPSPEYVAALKLRSRGEDAGLQVSKSGKNACIVLTTAPSSSFKFGRDRIYLRRVAARRLHIPSDQEALPGQAET